MAVKLSPWSYVKAFSLYLFKVMHKQTIFRVGTVQSFEHEIQSTGVADSLCVNSENHFPPELKER